MNALVLWAVLSAAMDQPMLQEPTLNVVAQLELAGGARATQEPFFFGLNALLGARFDPVRFGVQARGLFANQSGLDLGGFFTVDLVRLKIDSRLAIALFTGIDVMARWVPLRASAWSTVVLGHTGLRALGLSLTVAGGAELPSGQGDGEVRLGIDFVEFITFLHLQRESTRSVF